MVGASRITGAAVLHGSDFEHNRFIRLTVRTAEWVRDLSHDWHHARDILVEVDLTEAQWCTLFSSLNVGEGVPCTINFDAKRGHAARLPPIERATMFKTEANQRINHALQEIEQLRAEIDALDLPKAKALKLKSRVAVAVQELRDNLPFVAKSFGEHMEKFVEKAKAEVHGYVMGTLTRLGLDRLGEAPPLKVIDAEKKEPVARGPRVEATKTNDQIARVMLEHGTEEQQREALLYATGDLRVAEASKAGADRPAAPAANATPDRGTAREAPDNGPVNGDKAGAQAPAREREQ